MEEITKRRSSEFLGDEMEIYPEIFLNDKKGSRKFLGNEKFFGTGNLKMFGGLKCFRSLQL